MMEKILVFGSNTEGRHGKGAAKLALMEFGAVYGQAKGLQGRSYAIITKDLSKGPRSVSLESIKEQVDECLNFAFNNPNLLFIVTPIGCGLAGFKYEEIAPMFSRCKELNLPNVILPREFESYY